jgi:hypothetical protein
MPKRFLTYSRTEPARTILWTVATLSGTFQAVALCLGGVAVLPNTVIVVGVAAWAVWACKKNNIKHMARSSFWLFLFWLFSGLSRLFLTPHPSQLMWVPFIVVAMVMSVVYLYLSNRKRIGDLD